MIKNIVRLKQHIKEILIRLPIKANYKFILKDWVSLKDLNIIAKVLETKRFSHNLSPVIMTKPDAQRALVISPHQDDDVLSSGGTILKLISDGCKVKVVYLTSDSKSEDANNELEQETKEVSRQLGTDLEFWRYPTKKISIDEASKSRLIKLYFEFKPEVVFLPFLTDDHDDHRRTVHLFYESFKDLKKLSFEIWAYQVYSTVLPNIVVDITDSINEKLRLINIWQSRKKGRDWAHYIGGLNAFNCRFLNTNQPKYAETFFVLPAHEYIELCKMYFEEPQNQIYYTQFYKSNFT